MRERFLTCYFAAVDTTLMPGGEAAIANLLSIFELEKAIYELRYELNNRPDWITIPVAGIARLLESA
jgi:predicted trehalose synthase